MPTDHDIPKLIINKLTKEQYEQAVKNADELYLTPDDIQGLPDQTGQSGKYLTTDGASASWTTIPTINNSTITIQKNSTSVGSFTLNQSSNKNINITVPTKTSDITNDSGFLTSHQTIKTLNTDNTTTQTTDDNENIVGSGTINLHKVSKTGSYNDLLDKPSIPTVNNSTITIQKNGTNIDSFTTNTASGKNINITLAKGDVGLGNVDNTSDATKNSATATLDNKTIDGGTF